MMTEDDTNHIESVGDEDEDEDLDQVINMLSLTPSINSSNIRSTFESIFEENENSISLLLASAMEGKPLNFSVEGYGDENSIKTTTSRSISRKDETVTYSIIETITIPNVAVKSDDKSMTIKCSTSNNIKSSSSSKKDKVMFDSKTITLDETYVYHESIHAICDIFIKDIYSIDRFHDKRTAFNFSIISQLYDLRERYIASPSDILYESICNLLCVVLD